MSEGEAIHGNQSMIFISLLFKESKTCDHNYRLREKPSDIMMV